MNIQHRLHRDWSERNSCEQVIKNFVDKSGNNNNDGTFVSVVGSRDMRSKNVRHSWQRSYAMWCSINWELFRAGMGPKTTSSLVGI